MPGNDETEAGAGHFSGFIGIEQDDQVAFASFSRSDRVPVLFETEESLAALRSAAPNIQMLKTLRMIGFGAIRQITSIPVCIH